MPEPMRSYDVDSQFLAIGLQSSKVVLIGQHFSHRSPRDPLAGGRLFQVDQHGKQFARDSVTVVPASLGVVPEYFFLSDIGLADVNDSVRGFL